ncbi:hypothetical protein GS416_10715 [Rhodococcus hoagii]|nr:hypothetical protein [Prescottella equi]
MVPLLPAQDHKRVGDGDTAQHRRHGRLHAAARGCRPTAVPRSSTRSSSRRGRDGQAWLPFTGLLYAGLAMGKSGPAVVEFNCRFGDPETQAVLALLESPLGEVLNAAATGTLASVPPLQWRDGAAVTVVLAAENYPATPRTGTSSPAPTPTRSCTPAPTPARTATVVSAGGRC